MIRDLKEIQPSLRWHVPHLDKAERPRPTLYRPLRRPLTRALRRPELIHRNPSKLPPAQDQIAA